MQTIHYLSIPCLGIDAEQVTASIYMPQPPAKIAQYKCMWVSEQLFLAQQLHQKKCQLHDANRTIVWQGIINQYSVGSRGTMHYVYQLQLVSNASTSNTECTLPSLNWATIKRVCNDYSYQCLLATQQQSNTGTIKVDSLLTFSGSNGQMNMPLAKDTAVLLTSHNNQYYCLGAKAIVPNQLAEQQWQFVTGVSVKLSHCINNPMVSINHRQSQFYWCMDQAQGIYWLSLKDFNCYVNDTLWFDAHKSYYDQSNSNEIKANEVTMATNNSDKYVGYISYHAQDCMSINGCKLEWYGKQASFISNEFIISSKQLCWQLASKANYWQCDKGNINFDSKQLTITSNTLQLASASAQLHLDIKGNFLLQGKSIHFLAKDIYIKAHGVFA